MRCPVIDWYAPQALCGAVKEEAAETTGHFFGGMDRMALFLDPPAWHIDHDTYGEGERLTFVRACTDAELLAIYRYTAEYLHKERVRTAQACHIGQAVLSAVGSGLIKVLR